MFKKIYYVLLSYSVVFSMNSEPKNIVLIAQPALLVKKIDDNSWLVGNVRVEDLEVNIKANALDNEGNYHPNFSISVNDESQESLDRAMQRVHQWIANNK